ncbi:hypothetical protein MVEN_02121400 [Mycena venus]|uniref:Mug135-like C-terminal domain-containing protein n=1 Tax=Mycena venus TaxID=2733690 RepID=A0A8H7CHT9_9AGAR|nr:hypothetical protein MVEN_02121400 [Mycena venus]
MAAMLPLPPLPQVPVGLPAYGVPPPTAPATNPPTLIDVTNAHDYNERLSGARNAARLSPRQVPAPTELQIAEGLLYEKTIIELVGGPGVMPAWFQQWNATQFQPFVQSMNTKLATSRAQFDNRQCATGHQAPSGVVLFISGDDPTALPYLLPAIRNITDITTILTPPRSPPISAGTGSLLRAIPLNGTAALLVT